VIRAGGRRSAFTLIELLTVVAIMGVLASLLLTAVMSGKKRSRVAVCTFNLHQICLAVDMYLDEFSQRPDVDALVSNKYLPARASLLCPEDKTRNWGRLVRNGWIVNFLTNDLTGFASSTFASQPVAPNGGGGSQVSYSYLLDPLDWDETMWKRLMRKGGLAGIAACQLHGLGSQENPSVLNYSGLLLRGQRDGSVVRRQIFWNPGSGFSGPNRIVADSSTVFTGITTDGGVVYLFLSVSPFQFFLDDPADLVERTH